MVCRDLPTTASFQIGEIRGNRFHYYGPACVCNYLKLSRLIIILKLTVVAGMLLGAPAPMRLAKLMEEDHTPEYSATLLRLGHHNACNIVYHGL